YQINVRQSYGVKVELAPYSLLGNASAYQIGIKRPGRVGRHIEQRLTREGMAPFMDTAGIEFLRIPGTGKLVEILHELGREWLKACLAILGPRSVQVQTMTCPIQMSQGERAEFVGPQPRLKGRFIQ